MLFTGFTLNPVNGEGQYPVNRFSRKVIPMGKRGPKPTYERIGANKDGAPLLSVRLDPPVYEHIKAQPEGPRAYLQRLVGQDMPAPATADNQ